MPGRPKVALLAGAVAAAGAACVGYGILVERDWYRLRRERVEALAPGQPPLTVLHLSDLHLTVADGRRLAFLERLAGERVDLVVLTGDMLGEPGRSTRSWRPWAGSGPGWGRWPCSAPTTTGRPGSATRSATSSGPARAGTAARAATRGGSWSTAWRPGAGRCCPTAAAGSATSSWPAWTTPTSAATTRGRVPPNGRPRLRLGVVHSPYRRALDAFERNGYGLLLAGHTHGGQVRLPGVGALVTNCDLPRDQVRGLSRWGSSWLHVSAGLGTSKYAPFRFACRPEASLLTVVPRA